jgi:nitrite reductase/ring-hydroxylating ferredoxin subunit
MLTCPWHGFQYDVKNGNLLSDPSSHLQNFPVTISGNEVHLSVPDQTRANADAAGEAAAPEARKRSLQANEVWVKDLPPGGVKKVRVNGEEVAVYRVGDSYYATQEECTHAGGPLSEGDLEGSIITCPWHGSCFDVATGAVKCGPARKPLQVFHPKVDGDVLKVEE